jgi:hypothetical protein
MMLNAEFLLLGYWVGHQLFEVSAEPIHPHRGDSILHQPLFLGSPHD